LQPAQLASLIQLVEEGAVNFSAASSRLLPALIKEKNTTALQLATNMQLLQTNNMAEMEEWINTVLQKMPDKVAEYKKGKKGLIGVFVGEVKKNKQRKS